jgi:hypothetical protein
VTGAALDQPRLIEDSTRPLSAPELDTRGGPQLVAGPSAGPAPFGLADPCLADADDGAGNGEPGPARETGPRPATGTLPGQRAVGAAS